MHTRFADLRAIELVTPTNVPKCWVSRLVPPGLTLEGMGSFCSLIQDWSFSHELFPPGSRASCLLGRGLFHSSTHCKWCHLSSLVSLWKQWWSATPGLVFQENVWEFPWQWGSWCRPAYMRGLASDANPEPLWSINCELRRIYMTVWKSS